MPQPKPDIRNFRPVSTDQIDQMTKPSRNPDEFLNSDASQLHARLTGQAEEEEHPGIAVTFEEHSGPVQRGNAAFRMDVRLVALVKDYSKLTGLTQGEILENALREYLPKLNSRIQTSKIQLMR